jgi:Lrp/AsnC family transcriptional regulator, leucine-responsive regulatory protein
MNRSRYVNRPIDKTDRAIIAALTENGRVTFKDLAEQIELSSPSVTERIRKLEDCGAIRGYTITITPKALGLNVAAHVRFYAMPGEVKKVGQMLKDSPEVIEAVRVTGQDCFLATVVVRELEDIEKMTDRFERFASTDVAIIQSVTVAKRLPKF